MGLLQRMEQQKTIPVPDAGSDKPVSVKVVDIYKEKKERIHLTVIDEINKSGTEKLSDASILTLIEATMEREDIPRADRAKVSSDIYNDVMGYGPLEDLLKDPAVSEIMVNGPDCIYVERKGKLVKSDVTFRDNRHVMNIVDRIVSSVGRHIDEASPMVDARLKDGSRVNVIIPPLSLVGPVITIRKFSKTPLNAQNLLDFGSLNQRMLSFLEACVRGRMNVIVSGGTGSGKTTLLNVLSSFIPEDERIVTIEDAAELQLVQDHVVTLESRPANIEGSGQISIRDLVRNALRMRPDRIIVGEVRSGETLDMLQAMNTGHDGSLTTTHANSPRDTVSRLETMVLMSGMELPIKAIRDQISSAIDIIVQQTRLRDGSRKIVNITEITGMEGDTVSMQDIFTLENSGQMDVNGKVKVRFRPTGVYPMCVDKIRENGVAVYDDWFRE